MPVRLIADDLTGALDTAAPFASADRPIPVFVADRLPAVLPPSFALDLGSRDRGRASAMALAARHARRMSPGPGVTPLWKLDSLLRGSGGHELAVALGALGMVRCVVAPAFPFHGRVTRGGRQWVADGGRMRPTGENLQACLLAHGIPVRLARAGERIPPGVSLWDAERDCDLRRIAQAGRDFDGTLLWAGSGGLAGALAGRVTPSLLPAERPLLGLFGSDEAATAAQLAACGGHVLRVRPADKGGADVAARQLERSGVCLVAFVLPDGTSRSEASTRIARGLEFLSARVPRPRSLVVAGGETLRSVVKSVGCERLDVRGQVLPGLPVSLLRGGLWDGAVLLSKSGAFGEPGLLCRLLGLSPAP